MDPDAHTSSPVERNVATAEDIDYGTTTTTTELRETLPLELVESILTIAAQSIPPEEYLPLLLVSRSTYSCVSQLKFRLLKIRSRDELNEIETLLHSRTHTFFATCTRALLITLRLDEPKDDPSLLWTFIIPSLPNLESVSIWNTPLLIRNILEPSGNLTLNSQINLARREVLNRLISLQKLRFLMIDWSLQDFMLHKFETLDSAKIDSWVSNITHLALTSWEWHNFDKMSLLKSLSRLTSLTHLSLYFPLPLHRSEIDERSEQILHILEHLQVLVLSPVRPIILGSSRFGYWGKDHRVIVDIGNIHRAGLLLCVDLLE
ncbi:hypothetical protein DL96DRAFT_1781601 [Flagelloscypha sp. PMI_526]|nr:hypothetical protein DL96DRAFT_1781601 [Flagelloscypha sp. PMI_526]